MSVISEAWRVSQDCVLSIEPNAREFGVVQTLTTKGPSFGSQMMLFISLYWKGHSSVSAGPTHGLHSPGLYP